MTQGAARCRRRAPSDTLGVGGTPVHQRTILGFHHFTTHGSPSPSPSPYPDRRHSRSVRARRITRSVSQSSSQFKQLLQFHLRPPPSIWPSFEPFAQSPPMLSILEYLSSWKHSSRALHGHAPTEFYSVLPNSA